MPTPHPASSFDLHSPVLRSRPVCSRAKYPNGDPEESGNFLRGAGAAMGGGDYVKGWIPLAAGTEWVPPRRKPDATEVIITAADCTPSILDRTPRTLGQEL